MAGGQFERLSLLVPDPYDYILSKAQWAGLKDSDDAAYLFRLRKLQGEILRERYPRELRVYMIARPNITAGLWSAGSKSSSPQVDRTLMVRANRCGQPGATKNRARWPSIFHHFPTRG
jgi:hypothetical protein